MNCSIVNMVRKIFVPPKKKRFPPLVAHLDLRVRLGRHQCIKSLRIPSGHKEMLSWPEMPSGDDVICEVKKID